MGFIRQRIFSIRQSEVDDYLKSLGGYLGKLRLVGLTGARQAFGDCNEIFYFGHDVKVGHFFEGDQYLRSNVWQ